MTITREDVVKAAKLARIKVTEPEIQKYQTELSKIMDLLDNLSKVNTEGLEPLVNVNEHNLATREDVVTDGNCVEKILKNAPKQKLDYFLVPKVIEEQ